MVLAGGVRGPGVRISVPDPGAAELHQGLAYLMFGLRDPGVTVRPIGRLDGKPRLAEILLDEAFVPDEDVIGEPGRGWRIAMSATGDERGLTLRSPAASWPPPTG
ncbi:hypothetical protein SBADM41S_00154 [Streptomyces badius]